MLDHTTEFHPEAPIEEFLARVPAAWCVYLLADGAGRPVQLLCVKNLRASLKRRLGGAAPEDAVPGPSRRIDYRQIVRLVSWSRVDSAFEQDLLYLETARNAFPESYAGVLGFLPAWWVHADPAADRPRFTRTTEPGGAGCFLGPLPDKNSAQTLVHSIEDLFDLCRDPAALAAAPAGPCQWRQMSKCVGPCDGSVSLRAYRALVSHAIDVLADLPRAIQSAELRMRQAAAAMNFEAAGQIKLFALRLASLREGAGRHLRPIEHFRFLAVMPGPRPGTAKLFGVTPGEIEPLACLREAPGKGRGEDVLRLALESLTPETGARWDMGLGLMEPERQRISLVTHHLFAPRRSAGVLIPLAELDDKALVGAFGDVNRPRRAAQGPREDDDREIRGLKRL